MYRPTPRPGGGLVPQVRVHRLDANPSAGSGQALGLGLTRAEEHAGLATRHFELAISSRPLRLNLHHTHLAEGVVPEAAPLLIARVPRSSENPHSRPKEGLEWDTRPLKQEGSD